MTGLDDPERDQLCRDIDRIARLRGSFTLRSGQVSDEYFDKYRFEADPALLRRVAEQMVPLLPADTEVLGGLELGGIPIVTMISQLSGLPAAFIRKEAKTYGTCRLAEGHDVDGAVVTLIEDVISSGGAVIDATRELRGRGATARTVVCVIDRRGPEQTALADLEVEVRSVLLKRDLDAVAGLARNDGQTVPVES